MDDPIEAYKDDENITKEKASVVFMFTPHHQKIVIRILWIPREKIMRVPVAALVESKVYYGIIAPII